MSSIIVLIIGGLLLLFLELFTLSVGLVSFGAICAIEVYNRIEWWKFAILFMVVSIGIDSYFGYYIGTYFICIVAIVSLHSGLKMALPYDRQIVRLSLLFVSFLLFHLLRNYLGAIQIASIESLQFSDLLVKSIIRAIIETGAVVLITHLYETYIGRGLSKVKLKL